MVKTLHELKLQTTYGENITVSVHYERTNSEIITISLHYERTNSEISTVSLHYETTDSENITVSLHYETTDDENITMSITMMFCNSARLRQFTEEGNSNDQEYLIAFVNRVRYDTQL